MLKVDIERENWSRGSTGFLRDPANGKMCAMGFACLAAGLDEKDISGRTSLGVLYWDRTLETQAARERLKRLLHSEHPRQISKIHDALVTANDGWVMRSSTYGDLLPMIDDFRLLSDWDREKAIMALGLLADIEFSFVD